jgi:hypothetical protein
MYYYYYSLVRWYLLVFGVKEIFTLAQLVAEFVGRHFQRRYRWSEIPPDVVPIGCEFEVETKMPPRVAEFQRASPRGKRIVQLRWEPRRVPSATVDHPRRARPLVRITALQ